MALRATPIKSNNARAQRRQAHATASSPWLAVLHAEHARFVPRLTRAQRDAYVLNRRWNVRSLASTPDVVIGGHRKLRRIFRRRSVEKAGIASYVVVLSIQKNRRTDTDQRQSLMASWRSCGALPVLIYYCRRGPAVRITCTKNC
jgi:hypothetical protein